MRCGNDPRVYAQLSDEDKQVIADFKQWLVDKATAITEGKAEPPLPESLK